MKVLLIRLREIGDVVFTTPAVRAVRQRFPTAHISYLVEPAAAPVVEGNPHIDDVIVAPRRRGATGLANEIALARRIRRERFDLVIDFHGGPRASILAWLSGAPERIGYEVVGRAWMYTTRVARARELRRRHSVENQWDLLASLGIAAPSPQTSPVEMAVDQATSARVGKRLTDAGIGSGDELIVIHVSAGNPFRRWPLASFASVAARLAAADPARRIVVTSGPSEGDAADLVIQQARAAMPPAARPRLVASGDFSIRELRALFDRASLFIGGDSGPAHVASASAVPIVTLYGPTLPERSAPWRSPAVPALAIDTSGLPCRPCSQRVCEPGDFRCLTRIAPERVVDAAEQVLGTSKAGKMSQMHAQAAVSAGSTDAMGAVDRVEQVGLVAIFGVAVALQFSIAAAQSLLAVAIACWLTLVVTRREPIVVPRFFWALAAFAGANTSFRRVSPAPAQGLVDAKQLLLFLVVP